ncbi:MAG: hypothetical protein IJR00_10420 [Lachnospiraceae bacterium]|nr:hypothetical protein [Lachnospiraceae bacterium]
MNLSSLLEMRHRIRVFYIRFEQPVKYVLRFILALCCIAMINARLGYWTALSSFVVTFLVALLCAVVPLGFTALGCALLILAHLYKYSLESCAIAMVIFLCVYLMYYRFSPHDALVILLTPLLFAWHIPTVMPFIVGLLFAPVSLISMAFGVVIYFFLHSVSAGSVTGGSFAAEESIGKVQTILQTMIGDRTMLVYVAAFVISGAAIYILRRRSIDRAWPIAIGVGAFVCLLVLLVGDLAMDASVGILGSVFGVILGVIAGFVILFFTFHVDYSRVEHAQFEDEEYYYYVKAVPKIILQERQVRVRSINRAHDTDDAEEPHERNRSHAKGHGTGHGAEREEAKRQERAGANRTAHKPKPRQNAARPNRKETEGKKSSSS